jgi:hypothetical protein
VLEARIQHLADALGIEMPTIIGDGEGTTQGPGDASRPISSAAGTLTPLGLVQRKIDEIASALGLTPQELENYARSETRGNLAGIVLLRDQAGAMSPRMAGMIAGQEDRLGQLEARMNEEFKELDNKFLDFVDGHDLRIRKLEEINGIKSPPRNAALDNLERRMNRMAGEDFGDAGPRGLQSPSAKAKAAAKQLGEDGGATFNPEDAADADGPRPASGPQDAMTKIKGEVNRLTREATEIKGRLEQLDQALDALRAGTPASVVQAALGSSGDIEDSAATRSEGYAKAAAEAAEECQRLKDELAEIVNAVNVPSPGLEDSILEGEMDLDDEMRDDAARQYVERQSVMEARLKQLEEQLDSASVVMPESQIFSSLRAVIKDVRRCLSRCELLYQLPEIKMFIKRFQRSLEVNAILHEKWIGPGAGKRTPAEGAAEQDQEDVSNHPSEGQMIRDAEYSRSAPDLRAKRGLGKRGEGPKKKPFRTVVDWVRPHTPLKLDPMFKGAGAPEDRDRAGGSRGDGATHLPQINR